MDLKLYLLQLALGIAHIFSICNKLNNYLGLTLRVQCFAFRCSDGGVIRNLRFKNTWKMS